MPTGIILLLGAFAGLTIYLGLPMAFLRQTGNIRKPRSGGFQRSTLRLHARAPDCHRNWPPQLLGRTGNRTSSSGGSAPTRDGADHWLRVAQYDRGLWHRRSLN